MRPPGGRARRWYRPIQIYVRDVVVLFRQFRVSLLAYALTVVGGGSLYYWLAQRAGEARPGNLIEAWYVALLMTFLQAGDSLPPTWHLELFYFIMPIIGLAILSQGVADFGLLLFNRRARGEAWQVALAETYSNHIVIIGLGHLGFRVARALHQLGETYVAIELDPEADLMAQVQSWDVPVIRGDANKFDVLRRAGIERAHTVVIVTSDDTLNLQIAIHARAVNPKVRTIVRLFDDDFSRAVRIAFGITAAYSASALAAPAFAAAAADLDVSQPVSVGGRTLNMSHYTLRRGSPLCQRPVGQVEREYDMSVVLLRRADRSELHPADELILEAGDQITVFADSSTLHRLNRLNR